MAYAKTLWKARQCTNPCKFTKSEETADTVVLINTPDSVSVPGTLFSPENMNHIEQGIKDAHDAVDAEVGARQAADAETLRAAKAYADEKTPGIDDIEFARVIGDHNASDTAHADIRQLVTAEAEARQQGDSALARAITAEAEARARFDNDCRSLIEYLVRTIESTTGPIQRSFPLAVEGGFRLVTENGYILTTA